ncbi:MAG: hypothetical protein MJZ65_01110 [Paludibacteraceae bacterium]|nr:hypothetical protein [Paludibacteraceae bacterium]
MNKVLLRIGAAIFFIIAIGHLACLLALEQMFEFYNVTPIYEFLYSMGSWLPYAVTIGLVCCFTVAGLYGLAAAGDIKLPLTKLAIITIETLFALRWIAGIVMLCTRGFSWLEICNLTIITIILISYAKIK